MPHCTVCILLKCFTVKHKLVGKYMQLLYQENSFSSTLGHQRRCGWANGRQTGTRTREPPLGQHTQHLISPTMHPRQAQQQLALTAGPFVHLNHRSMPSKSLLQ